VANIMPDNQASRKRKRSVIAISAGKYLVNRKWRINANGMKWRGNIQWQWRKLANRNGMACNQPSM
jgi:hypothetical protein